MDTTKSAAADTRASLDVRLFGSPDATCDGLPVKFAKRVTTFSLIAMLVLKRGQAVSRDALAFTLFPDVDEPTALGELRRYLYNAKKALPESIRESLLIVDQETIRWNEAADVFVDVSAFERHAAAPEGHAHAIDLYAGDLLEDVYDDWILPERERLRGRYLTVLTESIARYRERRDYAAAIACARRLLGADPWREDALRALLAARYESGDAAGALAEFEAFAKRLRDELGVAPMAETLAVRRSIVHGEAIPGSFERPAPPGAAARATGSAALLPFVGRQRDYDDLYAAWGRAARGNGELVAIGGEAGVGKTRLTAELARSVQAEGGRVFVGTTSAPESTPYQALVEALRSALPLLGARPPAAARRAILARLLPELGEPGETFVATADAAAERETARLHDAIASAVRGLASGRPVLLVLEDLQWAGPATLEALAALVRDAARTPLLVVATFRDDETPTGHPVRTMLRALREISNAHEIELERFGLDDVAELVARLDGLRTGGEALARELYAHSEGNALLLTEAVAAALAGADSGDESPRGASVATLVNARVARLGDGARAVAEIAAIAGAGCNVALIRDVSNLPASAIARGIDELLDGRILREASARAHADYVFTHHLIGEALYAAIEPAFRAQRHARIAHLLEAYAGKAGSSSREIARHYDAGGDAERAARWYLTAARESAAVYAYGDAIELAERGLEREPAPDLARDLLDVLERARGRRGDRAGQRASIDALEALAGTDDRLTFDVLRRRVALARATGDADDEDRLVGSMSECAEALGDDARAEALVQRATRAGLRSRPAEGIPPARAALAMFERLGDTRGQLDCLFLLVDFSTNVGDLDAAHGFLAAMHERASSVADRVTEARALAVAGTAALLRQEYRACFDLTLRALALDVETGDYEAEAAARGRLAVTAAWLGDFTRALGEFERALEMYETIGHKRGIAVTHTNRTLPLMRLGLFDEALRSIERSTAYFESVREQRTIVANDVNASFVLVQRGEAARAKALATGALLAAREIGFPVFEAAALANLGNAERELGELDAAIGHMTAGIALRRPIQDAHDFADDLADLARAYARAGRGDDALATARELESLADANFAGSLWPHYVWWAIAEGSAAGGDQDAAARALASARRELDAFAARIEDAGTRRAFLAIPINAIIRS